tara:strand:- start:7509 stop:8804 length:1296 start_codon:yes stop_codon:yes gene_type:complete
MKRYETYKETKLQWVNNIPNHWIEGKVKYLFDIGRGRVISQQELNPNGRYPVYSSQTKNDGCLGHIDTFDFDDDILTWTTDGANAGEVFKRNGKFNCTNVCGTLKPKKELNLVYFLYLMKFLTPFYKRPDTNGAKIMNGEMAEIISYFPSLVEQTQIAAYLDYKTGLIDSIIAQKEELIKKLKEQRQAIISEAVTKGLNKDVKLKDSGIEWLGEIPEHWKSVKFRFKFETTKGLTITKADLLDEGIPCVNYGEIHSKYGFEVNPEVHNLKYVSEEYLETNKGSLLSKGDFVFADTSEDIEGAGNFTHLNSDIPTFAGYHTIIARLNDNSDFRFIAYFMDSSSFRSQIQNLVKGVKVYSITNKILKDTILFFPPKEEQKMIAEYIDNKVKKIFMSTEKLEKSIKKLKEYRQSLISEAVTGKIDVRDWQAPKS